MIIENLQFIIKLCLKKPAQCRYLWRWFQSLPDNYLIKNQLPWLVFAAIDFLEDLDLKGKKVFEYGSGGSTLFWLRKGANCVSLEHDRSWYEKMKPLLEQQDSVNYRLAEPELLEKQSTKEDYTNPDTYRSGSPDFTHHSFQAYIRQIDSFPDHYFDVILVDGRARPAAIAHSIKKLAMQGILIVDNSDRDYYFTQTMTSLKTFKHQSFAGLGPTVPVVWKTDIFTHQY
jgi:hypothetical protein